MPKNRLSSKTRLTIYNERTPSQTHSHSEGQFVYPLKGSAWVQVGMANWYIHSDCGLWIPPHRPHSATFVRKVEVVALYLEKKQCTGPLAEEFSVRVSPLLRELLSHSGTQLVPPGAISKNKDLFKLLLRQIVACRTQNICLPYASEPRLIKSLNHVTRHIDQDPSLVAAAKAGGASPKTLERLILKAFDSDFRTWKQSVKMVMAAAYLHEGKSMTDVALSVGYDSMSAFIHCFKKYYGTTPSRYLK